MSHPFIFRIAAGLALMSISPALAAPGGAEVPQVSIPAHIETGPPKQTQVLLETDHVKLVLITLRQGTLLPEHAAPVPVTIQTITGKGAFMVGEQAYPLFPGRIQALPSGLSHRIKPEADGDLVLLVTYPKPESGPEGHHHH